ncbi:putative leucine--tRNA ligase mitochondrial [Taenia crassiceps]|uniref:leucine--tRNA ligase n=1 Tax=Taenia crassiceps TaxID=6207 RepID=A0ABR4QQ11_9CEST
MRSTVSKLIALSLYRIRLHMGHLRVYTVTDVLVRYYRLLGHQVIFPMGWDAFGLPAENAAIDRGVLPDEWTCKNIQNMRKQLRNDMKLSFDWTLEIATCDPNYYRWTQWLFIKLFEAGLAYRRLAEVNWDPIDKTVLANELVDAEGRSWRSGALVEKRVMRQWYFRTLAYSESLKDGLGEIRGQQWRDVIQMQEGWIGSNDGFVVEFDLDFHSTEEDLQGERLAVFTKQPGLAAAGAISFIAVGPQSIFWNERFRFPQNLRGANGSRKLATISSRSSLGKLSVQPAASCHPWPEKLNISVKHLLTDTCIPLIYDPELRSRVEYETAIELGTPDICDRHRQLSRFLDLPPPECQIDVNCPLETDIELRIRIKQSPLPEFNGLNLKEATALAVSKLKASEYRLYRCSQNRKDWPVSRQRYWATPIPLIYCQNCGTVPVPEEDLPVELPPLKAPLKRGDVPLREITEWRYTTCPSCGSPAEREIDTLDTFVDSSWYYLRFLDPTNSKEICSRDNAHKHIPVDIYVGGVEHAIRHLFYARFIAHFLHRELGLLPCREPFQRFLPVGLVMGKTFRSPTTGQYFPAQEIEKDSTGNARLKATGEVVEELWEKMSKSKLNGVDPSEVFARHGVELTRLTMLASVGPHAPREWNEGEILRGVKNWQSRLWRLIGQLIEFSNNSSTAWPSADQVDYLVADKDFLKIYAHIVEQVHHHYGESFVLSAVIANLQKLTSILLKHSQVGERCISSRIYLKALADLIVMLHPLAPLFTCELWRGFSLALCSAPPEALDHIYAASDWHYHLQRDVMEQRFPRRMDQGRKS